MCKFSKHLFVLLLLHVVGLAVPRPLQTRNIDTDLVEMFYDEDYDDDGFQLEERHYDQRQKGNENLKLSLEGFVIGLPNGDASSWMEILAAEYLDYALAVRSTTREPATNYQMLAENNVTEYNVTENNAMDAATANVISIPAPKKDIESRQQVNDELLSSPRTKLHMLQLLQKLRRTHN